jgi:hypothetical protein
MEECRREESKFPHNLQQAIDQEPENQYAGQTDSLWRVTHHFEQFEWEIS